MSTNPVNDHDGGNDATSQVSPPAETSTVRTSGKNSTMITDSNGFFNGGMYVFRLRSKSLRSMITPYISATWFNQENTAGACGHVHSDYDYIVALSQLIKDYLLTKFIKTSRSNNLRPNALWAGTLNNRLEHRSCSFSLLFKYSKFDNIVRVLLRPLPMHALVAILTPLIYR